MSETIEALVKCDDIRPGVFSNHSIIRFKVFGGKDEVASVDKSLVDEKGYFKVNIYSKQNGCAIVYYSDIFENSVKWLSIPLDDLTYLIDPK